MGLLWTASWELGWNVLPRVLMARQDTEGVGRKRGKVSLEDWTAVWGTVKSLALVPVRGKWDHSVAECEAQAKSQALRGLMGVKKGQPSGL